MGKIRRRVRDYAMDSSSDDDSYSIVSSGSSEESGGRVDEVDLETLPQLLLDTLFEKRAAARESALRGLLEAFTRNVMTDFVDRNYETLLDRFLASIKKGSSMEKALAARALCLQVLTAGPGEIADQVMAAAWPHLVQVAKHDSSPSSRVAAIETMGVLPFVADVELEVIENSLDAVWQICSHKGNYHSEQVTGVNKPSSAVKSAALSSWALLLSTVPTARIANHYSTLSMPTLSNLLKDEDCSVRKAAGEVLVLICNAVIDQGEDLTYEGISGGKRWEGVEAQVVGQMKALSVQGGGKGQSKTERCSEMTIFKDLVSNIEGDGFRQPSVQLQGGDYLRIDNWTRTIQFKALRHVLAKGFQCHLQDNELLHAIFGYKPCIVTKKCHLQDNKLLRAISGHKTRVVTKVSTSKTKKRLYMSPNSMISKARTQTRNKDRSEVE